MGTTTSVQGAIANSGTVRFVQAGAGTYSGVLSGPGALTIAGGGTVTLSGTNTYSGGTTVTGSTVAVASDVNLGAPGGGLTLNAGTLQLAGPLVSARSVTLTVGGGTVDTHGFAGTLSGGLTGAGGLTILGGGTLTLSGASTYTGGTTVTAGTLVVGTTAAGSILGPVTVNAGGTLRGAGTITGAVGNPAGTVMPGSSGLGTLTVTGAYTQGAGGTLIAEVGPSAADLLTIGGAATVAGTLTLAFDPGAYAPVKYTLLDAAGGLRGTFGTVDVTGSLLLSYTLSYTANAVVLTIGNVFTFSSFAQTPNQLAVAQVLDAALPTASGDLATVFTALTALTTGDQVRAALDALTGVVYTSLPTATAADTWTAMDLIFQHLSDVQAGTPTAAPALTAFAPGLSGQAGPVTWPGAEPGDPTGWLTPLTSTQTLQGTANAPGFTNQSTGLLLGYDRTAGPGFTWGYAAGTWQSSLALATGGSTAGITTVAAATYGAYTAGAFEARGLVGYGVNTFQTTRPIRFGDLARTATASGTGNELMAGLEADYRLHAGGVTVRPTLGLQYVHLNEPQFTESGADSIDLSVNAVTADWLQALAGVRLEYAQTTAAGTQITYNLHAEYTTLVTEPVSQIQSVLLGAAAVGPFTTTGITAAPNAVGAGARITFHVADRYDLYASYDAAWSSNETNQTFSAGLLIHF